MRIIILIIIVFFSCNKDKNYKNSNCEKSFLKCNQILSNIERNDILEKICDFYIYEKDIAKFTKSDFIKFLEREPIANDSLIFWLKLVDFNFQITDGLIRGNIDIKTWPCYDSKIRCDSIESINQLFYQSEKSCYERQKSQEEEIFLYRDKKLVFPERVYPNFQKQLRIKLLNKFFNQYLGAKKEYFSKKNVKNHELKRVTNIACRKEERNGWVCLESDSQHKNKEYIQHYKSLVSELLNDEFLEMTMLVDSMLIPVHYFEDDQIAGTIGDD